MRVAGIDTPESVSPQKWKNSEQGKEVSAKAATILPAGSEVTLEGDTKDAFGRDVNSVIREINGVKIDYGLVALDQGMSSYYTKFGKHRDPLRHDQYKDFVSEYAPWNYSLPSEDVSNEMSREDILSMADRRQVLDDAVNAQLAGSGSQEAVDAALVGYYNDPRKVVAYRKHLYDMSAPKENNSGYRAVYEQVMNNPQARETYNMVMNNTTQPINLKPMQHLDWWEKAGVNYQQLAGISSIIDTNELIAMNIVPNRDTKIKKEELLVGVPPELHAAVTAYWEEHNDLAAIKFKEQIINDFDNNREIARMTLGEQLMYGAGAMILDPVSMGAADIQQEESLALTRRSIVD